MAAQAIASVALALLALGAAAAPDDEERGNWFGDPFVQVTAAIAACPTQEGPKITRAQMRAEAHYRAERGTSCWLSGQCRLPNSYLYDREIVPRVKKAIEADGRFADTSVWVQGQRRWVWLEGCVARPEQAAQLEALVRQIDDVEAVINELVVLAP